MIDPEIVRIGHSDRVMISGSGVGIVAVALRAANEEFVWYSNGWVNVRPPLTTLMLPACRTIQTNELFVEMPSKTSSPQFGAVRVADAFHEVTA